jgi:hypothetical protein
MALRVDPASGESGSQSDNYNNGGMRKGMVRRRLSSNIWEIATFILTISLIFPSCGSNSFEGKVLGVEILGEPGVSWEGSKLIIIDSGSSKKSKVLSKDFVSACAPSLSYDGRYLFFQGKKDTDESWQIWLMDLRKKSFQQVTDLPEDCVHPAALPDGSLIFSVESEEEGTSISSLHRCQRDGSGLMQITFNPGRKLLPSVLNEGRVLYISNQQLPEYDIPKLMIMRPDGTKSELYYPGNLDNYPASRAAESEDGHVYFITNNGSLSRVLHNRPLHSYENLSREIEGSFSDVSIHSGSGCLVSYRPPGASYFGLYEFKLSSGETPDLLYASEGHITQCLWISAKSERPKILPSAVNMDKKTGLLMSQDINHSILPVLASVSGDTLAHAIRVYDLDGMIGETEVFPDGSFYLEIDADTPVRIETINLQGETVRGPSDWIYLRPNERRACVGCHADQELAPKNFQPLAVKGPPVWMSSEKKENNL